MSNAEAWGLPGVLHFFDTARSSTDQVYASEWFFLKDRLREDMRILDVGCAQGGFATMVSEHLRRFHYTGIDISPAMIQRAQERHPAQRFHCIAEDQDWQALHNQTYDLVLVLGILHLHEGWRETIRRAWTHTAESLIMDLREHDGASIEDKAVSSFRMDFGGGEQVHAQTILPYNLINSAEALACVRQATPGARKIAHYGYLHPVSTSADTPISQVMTNVWCIER